MFAEEFGWLVTAKWWMITLGLAGMCAIDGCSIGGASTVFKAPLRRKWLMAFFMGAGHLTLSSFGLLLYLTGKKMLGLVIDAAQLTLVSECLALGVFAVLGAMTVSEIVSSDEEESGSDSAHPWKLFLLAVGLSLDSLSWAVTLPALFHEYHWTAIMGAILFGAVVTGSVVFIYSLLFLLIKRILCSHLFSFLSMPVEKLLRCGALLVLIGACVYESREIANQVGSAWQVVAGASVLWSFLLWRVSVGIEMPSTPAAVPQTADVPADRVEEDKCPAPACSVRLRIIHAAGRGDDARPCVIAGRCPHRGTPRCRLAAPATATA